MALKGFLASGFQKLIGASRIQGANTQWLGEYNKLSYTSNTAPISTVSPLFGFNYLNWTPTATVFIADTQALFSSNPTTEAIVTIRNSSAGQSIIFGNSGSVAGSLVGDGQTYLRPAQSITYLYDVAAARWRQISFSTQYRVFGASVASTQIQAGVGRIQSITISATADQTVTSIAPSSGADTGDIVYLFAASATNPITLQQDTTGAGSNTLIMNGDYVMTKYSVIGFMYDGSRWIEISRNMVGGY